MMRMEEEASTEQCLKVGTDYHLDPDNECSVQDQEEVGCSLQVVNMKKITKEAESSGWRHLYFTGLVNIMNIMGRRVRVLPLSQRRRILVLFSPSDCGNQALVSVDFFAGCGGPSNGLLRGGFNVTVILEN